MMKNNFPIKSATFHLPSREIQTAQYVMHVSFLNTANFLVTIMVKSERALLDKYE